MKQLVKKLAIGVSMAVGVGAIATTPAHAGSLTGVTIGGTAPNDYDVYGVQGNNTILIPRSLANAQAVLDGNAASPTGNVELRASTETSTFTANDFTKNTTLEGTIGGKSLVLSSLIASDWTSAYQGTTLGEYWFSQALAPVCLTSSKIMGDSKDLVTPTFPMLTKMIPLV
jgi:hypothetical protein